MIFMSVWVVFSECLRAIGGLSGGYLGGLGVIRLHVRQIEQRNTTGLSFVLSRILFCFFSEEKGWHHSILIWLFLLVRGINCKMSISYHFQ